MTNQLGTFLDEIFDRKQGDINATILNPLRLGDSKGSFSGGDVAIYKGEDVRSFSALPISPSDWAKPLQTGSQLPRESQYASEVLEQLKQIAGIERSIVLREVARLNTRERLTGTWFERAKDKPVAFTHELWRMILKDNATEEYGKALLAIIHSSVAAYLVNLFSTNNHIGKDDLGRMPIPDPESMPVTPLAKLADEMLSGRAAMEKDFVLKYGAKLPEFDGNVYIPPSTFLAATRLPELSIAALVGRGEVKNNGPVTGRIRALRARNLIISLIDSSRPNAAAFAQVLELFLNEPGRENESWSEAQHWQLPDSVAAKAWLDSYHSISQQAQTGWNNFVALQGQIDEVVANWYGFNAVQRSTINEGLPWARRRRNYP